MGSAGPGTAFFSLAVFAYIVALELNLSSRARLDKSNHKHGIVFTKI